MCIRDSPNITLHTGEVTELPAEGEVVVATGPLTSDALAQRLEGLLGEDVYKRQGGGRQGVCWGGLWCHHR